MNTLKFLFVRLVEIFVVIFIFISLPNIPPKASFTGHKVTRSRTLEGILAPNERLNGVEHLYIDKLKGPEAFADFNGELYTTLHGGDVVKLSGGHVVPIVNFGKPCKEFHEENMCGRPLGLKFDANGLLYVADAYNGIWKVNVETS